MLNSEVPTTLRGEALWGAKSIAAFLDVPLDKVGDLRKIGAPIGKVGGQVFALRSELLSWLQQQIAADRQ